MSAQPTEDDKAHALALFKESDQQYKRGEFESAAELLVEAYALFPEPILLYNLARALEGSGDTAGAIAQYERFLAAAPTVDDRGAIERRVATLRAELARRQEAAVVEVHTPEPIETPALPVSIDTSPSAGEPAARPRVLPWAIAGAGVAAIATGGVFGYLAGARHDDAIGEPVQAEAARLQDRAHGFSTAANVAFIGGGLLVAGGVVWGVIDRRRAHADRARAISVHVDVGPSWIGVAGTLP